MFLEVKITPQALTNPASNYKRNLVVMETTTYNYVFCIFMASGTDQHERGGDQELGVVHRPKDTAFFTGQLAILPYDCRFT